MACLIRVRECSGNDVTKLVNVAHVYETFIRVDRKSPANGSISLFLRSESADEVLVKEWRDHECMVCKAGLFDDRINSSLAGKVRHLELAATNFFDVGQR